MNTWLQLQIREIIKGRKTMCQVDISFSVLTEFVLIEDKKKSDTNLPYLPVQLKHGLDNNII